MIEFTVNWWAVIVAAVATFILGMLWYGPLFGKVWARLSGKDLSQKPSNMGIRMVVALVSNGVYAWGLAVLIGSLGITSVGLALCLAATVWGTFVSMTYLGAVLWENHSLKLFCFNTVFNLVMAFVVALIVVAI
jgi:hypothetical protein